MSTGLRCGSWQSEGRFDPNLNQSRRRRGDDLTERGTRDVAVNGSRPVELRMVEQVEDLEPELQVSRPAQREVLEEREVEVLDAGSIEESARRVAELAERRNAEAGRVE